MYNYDFELNEEKVICEKNNAIVEISNKTYELSILITNKNILFFNNVNKNNPLNSRGMYMPPEYLLETRIPIKELKYICKENNTYLNYKNTEVIVYDFKLSDYL